jgi:two-component system, chemotaxis family, chemotaxis protein CheV
MSELLKRVDARTKLAGTNKLEILLFTLGTDQRSGRKETFGINVFKVREVMRVPEITRAPDMPPSVEGMVSLRGVLVPVVDLIKYTGIVTEKAPEIMIVTEYNSRTQGFLVESVDTILRLDWSEIKVPPEMLTAQMGGLVTAVTRLEDGRLVMLMDVEKILAETTHYDEHELIFSSLVPLHGEHTIFFTDDSPVARKQIERTLDAMQIRYRSASNGKQAWDELLQIAARAEAAKLPVKNFIQ